MSGASAVQWEGEGGRYRTLRGAQVAAEHGWEVRTVVCVHDRKMKEPWCLVPSDPKVGTAHADPRSIVICCAIETSGA